MDNERMIFLESPDAFRIEEILDGWKKEYPCMGVLAILPEAEKGSVVLIQDICREKKIPLSGAVFPELVVDNGFQKKGVILLRFDEMPPMAIYSPLTPWDEEAQNQVDNIVEFVEKGIGASGDTSLFMIFDALIPNISTILDQLYLKLADRVHYMGVNAGSETFKPMPCLFNNERLIQNGVLAILLKEHKGAILEHGYRLPARMITATSTEGNRVITIDWRPAFDVYQEIMKEEYGVAVNRDNFYHYAVHFPFGIVRVSKEIVVRIPVALSEDGSLFCIGEIPPNSVLTLLRAADADSSRTVETLSDGLKALCGSTTDRDIPTFYCAGRRLHDAEKAMNELEELKRKTGASRLLGALSLGEIGSSTLGGYPIFHNATLVCCT